MPVSPHGLAIAVVWFLAILALLAFQPRVEARLVGRGRSRAGAKALLSLLLVVTFVVLRVQPIRMGGDPFAYSLGMFDAVTVFGLVMLWWRPRPSAST